MSYFFVFRRHVLYYNFFASENLTNQVTGSVTITSLQITKSLEHIQQQVIVMKTLKLFREPLNLENKPLRRK